MVTNEQATSVDRIARRRWLSALTPVVAGFAGLRTARASGGEGSAALAPSTRKVLAFDEHVRTPLCFASIPGMFAAGNVLTGLGALYTGHVASGCVQIGEAAGVLVLVMLIGSWLAARRLVTLNRVLARCAIVPARLDQGGPFPQAGPGRAHESDAHPVHRVPLRRGAPGDHSRLRACRGLPHRRDAGAAGRHDQPSTRIPPRPLRLSPRPERTTPCLSTTPLRSTSASPAGASPTSMAVASVVINLTLGVEAIGSRPSPSPSTRARPTRPPMSPALPSGTACRSRPQGTPTGPRRAPFVCPVILRVGSAERRLIVFGKRCWERRLGGRLEPSPALPFDRIALSFTSERSAEATTCRRG